MPPLQRRGRLVKWVREQVEQAAAGDMMPPDRVLAERFGLSMKTVGKAMAGLQAEGLVERVRGRGTMVPVLEPLRAAEREPVFSSVDTVVQKIHELIGSGDLRRGHALPQVKYIALEFRVSQRTVIEAYRRLLALGLVSRIGRTYWVGSDRALLHAGERRRVVLLKYESSDFGDVFAGDVLSEAYRQFEYELLSLGHTVRYESTADLAKVVNEAQGVRAPLGMILHRVSGPETREVFDRYPELPRRLRASGARLLIDRAWKGPAGESGPQVQELFERLRSVPGLFVLPRGHLYTAVARALATFLVRRGYRRVVVFENQKVRQAHLAWTFLTIIRIRTELRHLDRHFAFSLVIRPSRPGRTLAEHLGPALERGAYYRAGSEAEINLSKYELSRPEVLAGECRLCAEFEEAFGEHSPETAWVFVTDRDAADACAWCRSHGVSVPDDVSVIGLQNEPGYYHLGISTCSPDWPAVGYLMAHAVVGGIPVGTTTKGFLRTRARMVERTTTR